MAQSIKDPVELIRQGTAIRRRWKSGRMPSDTELGTWLAYLRLDDPEALLLAEIDELNAKLRALVLDELHR